jgi:integrase
MLMLGLRPGEATGLTWADIDIDAGVIHVRRSLKLEGGELVLSDRLKTSKSQRSIDAPPDVIDAMRRHRSRQASERLEVGPLWSNPDDLAFTTTIGHPLDPNNLRRTFARVTERAGLGRWKPHELRHSAASIMSASGLPLEEVADVLGHDGTRMTALVYRHAVKPTIDGAARVMGEAFG